MDKEVLEAIRDIAIRTDQINKRLATSIVIAFVCMAIMVLFWCIRDINISKQYFNQSVTQESTKDGLKQEFQKGGN